MPKKKTTTTTDNIPPNTLKYDVPTSDQLIEQATQKLDILHANFKYRLLLLSCSNIFVVQKDKESYASPGQDLVKLWHLYCPFFSMEIESLF